MNTPIRFLSVLAAAAFALTPPPASAAPGPDDILRTALPAPELYVKHHAALALTDTQAATVRAAVATMEREFREMTPVLETRTRELAAAVENPSASADEVQRKLDTLFETENRLKAARLRASLAARRAVTPEQWMKLSELRGAAAPREPASTGAEPTREDLLKKLARVRELNGQLSTEGPPPDLRRLFNEAQNKMRAGRTAEADRLFDRIIAEFEQRLADKSANASKP